VLLPGAVDLLTCILFNQWFFSCFETLTPSTRSMAILLPPRSRIGISFRSSGLQALRDFAMFNSHNSPKHRTLKRGICLHASSAFDGSDYFGSWGFDTSGIPHTSHFETPEAYFPKHLDQLPPVPLKINDSCSLWAFFSSTILHANFKILNAREPLI
jgi:hypothetical protein